MKALRDQPCQHCGGTGRIRLKHGTRYAYKLGCRCDRCRAANATYHRELYGRRLNK